MRVKKPPHYCPIDGTPYDPGSISDLVHRYIDAAQAEPEVEILRELFTKRELVFEWQSSIVRELAIHFAAHVSTSPKPRTYDEPTFSSWMRKWNQLGQTIGPYQPDLAEHLYKNLLSSLRLAQGKWGWVPKGLAYHQIGWSKILMRRSEDAKAAEHYFTVAMIEDVLHDLITAGKVSRYMLNPAYKVLSSLYQKRQAFFDGTIELTSQVYRAKSSWPKDLLIENAELILFERLMNGKAHSNSPR